ncbi:Uncharacterised protein [Klebsiella oxytoca]|nr:Uncharacterised protein [Klebsiella oxytoca]
MVGSGGIIPGGFRRPVAEEHRAGAGDAIDQFAGVAGLNNQVFRAVLVGYFHALGDIAGHDDSAGGERLTGGFRTRQRGQLALNGFGDAGGHRAIRRQQDHLRIRAVLRLGKQIRGDEIRGCAAVGDHQHFRWPGGHIDSRAVKTLAHLTLGLGDEGVARAKDFIDFRHRLRAEGEGGNCLRAADVKDIAHAA